jgi:choline transport protein
MVAVSSPNTQRDKHNMSSPEVGGSVGVGEVINASGHKQELKRQFGLLSICAVGITTGNVWTALGGAIVCRRVLPCG